MAISIALASLSGKSRNRGAGSSVPGAMPTSRVYDARDEPRLPSDCTRSDTERETLASACATSVRVISPHFKPVLRSFQLALQNLDIPLIEFHHGFVTQYIDVGNRRCEQYVLFDRQ